MKHVLLEGVRKIAYRNEAFEHHHKEVNNWPKFAVEYVGVCPSDFNLVDNPKTLFLVMGHEIVCYEQKLNKKQYYVINNEINCDRCGYCLEKKFSHCENLIELGVNEQGGYAEYIKIPRNYLIPIALDNVMLGVLVEPLACVLHAIFRIKNLSSLVQTEPVKILIVGSGVIGRMFAHLLMYSKMKHTLSIYDVNADSMESFAKNRKISILHALPNEAFDISIECSGAEVAMQACAKSVRKGGIVFLFGLQHPEKNLPFLALEFLQKELTVSSSFAGVGHRVAGKVLMRKAVDHIKMHEIFFESLLGSVISLEKLPAVFLNRNLVGRGRTVVKI